MKLDEIGKSVNREKNLWIEDFEETNCGYFESEDDLVIHGIKTIKKMYLVRKELNMVLALYHDALAGMKYKLGDAFGNILLFVLEKNPSLKPLNVFLSPIHGIPTHSYLEENKNQNFIDVEYAILSLNLKIKSSIEKQIKYLVDQIQWNYLSESYGTNELHTIQNMEYIQYCQTHIEMLNKYGAQFNEISAERKEFIDVTFVDSAVFLQVYYNLILATGNPKSTSRLIHKRDRDKLDRFLTNGKLKEGKKIFFKGDTKTLTYCFYQLRNNNLINRVEDPDKAYTIKELADIIFKTFTLADCKSYRSIYDYLRKKEDSRPLNPIYFIERSNDRKSPFLYNFFNPKFRKKGTPFNANDVKLFDTSRYEDAFGFTISLSMKDTYIKY